VRQRPRSIRTCVLFFNSFQASVQKIWYMFFSFYFQFWKWDRLLLGFRWPYLYVMNIAGWFFIRFYWDTGHKYISGNSILQLLYRNSIDSKHLMCFPSKEANKQTKIPNLSVFQVVYFGLHIVTPLISLDLLKYPKLCHDVRITIHHQKKALASFSGKLIYCTFLCSTLLFYHIS